LIRGVRHNAFGYLRAMKPLARISPN
jgi:hypothetical protein